MERLATGFGLVEGPVWDSRGLYFSDVTNGGVHLLDRQGNVSLMVPKRRGIGGMALHADGGLVIGGRDIAHVDLATGASRTLLALSAIPGATGFNDLTTDHAGRLYVGSLAFGVFAGEAPKPGYLHMIDLDGRLRTISDGIMLANGIAFSPDGKRLYHSDARSSLVRVHDVNPDGSVQPWQKFADTRSTETPDGLKVASDGSVLVAMAHGSRVAVFNPDGSHRKDIAVPLPMVTSLCFGGDDLSELYIVTGSHGGPHANCGTIFRVKADVPGAPMWPARVPLGEMPR
jgi:gluconolactonase